MSHHHYTHKLPPEACAALATIFAVGRTVAVGTGIKNPEVLGKLVEAQTKSLEQLKEVVKEINKEHILIEANKAEDQIHGQLNKEKSKEFVEDLKNKKITHDEHIIHVAEINNQFEALSALIKDGHAFIKSKVESGDICKLTKFQTTKLIYKYAQYVSKDENVIGLAQKMESIADHDYVAAVKHLEKKKLKKKQRSLSNRLFTIAKIAAIGGTLIFAPYMIEAVPAILALGTPGAVISTGLLTAATDALCQGAAIQLGIQDKFSINELLEAGVTGGLGPATQGLELAAKVLTTSAASAMTQGAEVGIGTREEMDIKSIAMQSAAVVTASVVDQAMSYVNTAIEETLPNVIEAVGEKNLELVTNGAAHTVANSLENKAVYGNSGSLVEGIITNVAGSAAAQKLGNAVGNAFSSAQREAHVGDKPTLNFDDMCLIESDTSELALPTNEELHAAFDNINHVADTLDTINASNKNTEVPFDFMKSVDAFNRGVELTTGSILQSIRHPIDTATSVGTLVWDGYNALTDVTLGISSEGSRLRNAERGKNLNETISNADIYTGIELGTSLATGMLLTGGTGSALGAVKRTALFDGALTETTTFESTSLRQARMLEKNTGYNISPESWFTNFDALGREGTFITDYRGIGEVLGPVRANAKFDVGLFSNGNTVSYFKARKLERSLGLEKGSLSEGFRFTRIYDINRMKPRSPLVGNSFFTKPGQGLPNGAPELVIDPVPTKPWPNRIQNNG